MQGYTRVLSCAGYSAYPAPRYNSGALQREPTAEVAAVQLDSGTVDCEHQVPHH
jgi:hypothetical protein